MASAWESRFARLVRTIMGLRESQALEVLPDLMPVLPVVDPGQAELRLARNEVLISALFDLTSAAGQFTTWWLQNPPGSGMLVVVDRIIVTSPAAPGEVRWYGQSAAIPGAPTPTATDDDRRPNTATRSLRVAESAAAALGGRAFNVQAGVTLDLPVRHVLPPGQSFCVQQQTANARLFGLITGYERPVGAAELQIA